MDDFSGEAVKNVKTPDGGENTEKELVALPDEKQAFKDELERTVWKRIFKRMKQDRSLYLMVIPLLLIYLIWRYFPLYELLGAFKDNNVNIPVMDRDFAGLHFFWDLTFGQNAGNFWPAFRNTFLLSFYNLLFGFPIPIILALFFNEVKNNIVRSGLQIITYLPKFVSTVVVTTLITLLVSGVGTNAIGEQPGVVSRALAAIGLISKENANTGLLQLPQYFRPIYIISGIWEAAGYGSIVYFAAIISIPPSSYEAAKMDGASKMQQIWHVVLPGIMSTITIMLILRLGELLSIGYEKVLLLYNTNTYVTADIVATYVFRTAGMESASGQGNISLASAADMVAALISMLLVIGSNMISRKISDTSLY